jgi:hypothetical protein
MSDDYWKERKEILKEQKRLRDAARKEQLENAEERLAIMEESRSIDKSEPAKQIPPEAKEFLRKLKYEYMP